MPLRTISEQAFENYLKSRNFNYRYEEPVPGISTLLDYAININGTTVRFEVAEWEPKVPLSGFHGVDMYGPIRTKISGKKINSDLIGTDRSRVA